MVSNFWRKRSETFVVTVYRILNFKPLVLSLNIS